MKLTSFIGVNIRGYLNFNIKFRERVTFLIGINGSGKTTVLKLISSLLSPSYKDLIDIEFELICLQFEYKDKILTISCAKSKDNLQLTIVDFDELLYSDTVDLLIKKDKDRLKNRGYEREFIQQEEMNFNNLAVVKKINKYKSHLFLGLNRKVDSTSAWVSQLYKFESRRSERLLYDERDQQSLDNIDIALKYIQSFLHEKIRINSKRQNASADLFRKQIFSESFKAVKNMSIPNINFKSQIEELNTRKNKLITAINNLEISDLKDQFLLFFDELSETLNILSKIPPKTNAKTTDSKYIDAMLRWLVNYSQMEKIDKIIQYASDYSETILNQKEPMNRFVKSINMFFEEGRKTIEIDDLGDIKVNILGVKKKYKVLELSSGEKQLIIMFAYLAFNINQNRTSVFVIDEPELSLHISWQQKFVDALLEVNPNTQFILATHAPSIIAHNSRKELCEDLSNT